MPRGGGVPAEALSTLRRRIAALPARHPERSALVTSTAQLYAVSRASLYRLLRGDRRPKDAHRTDRGHPRVMPVTEIERWCEIIAAMKIRTTNKKGRHLSTVRTLQLLIEHGVDTPDGFQQLAPGKLTASTVNRHLHRLGYDHARMTRQPPAVRFQAEYANALWHFDMSPSDLKHLKTPAWIDADRQGAPILMLFSVVDDRSGVAYQEYRCVYGEDVETALRFLFNAMAPKSSEADGEVDPFQGIPAALSLDNGPVGKSAVFKRVMESLGVEILPHMPAGSDGRRTTARAKGKVERPFRTVKEAHETLYHFHQPETEAEANRWLARFIATYNRGDHRSEPHARIDDWLAHLPDGGIRQMCAWERFCAFAREPERRLVGIDCRLTVAGVTYEVDAELAGETVVVWWGLFDQELWVEHGEERLGPFRPVGGPIPLHRYRKHRKSRHEVRADQVAALAGKLMLPRAALSGENAVIMTGIRQEADAVTVAVRPFRDPDPFHELVFANPIAARRAIADAIRVPLATLPDEDRAFIDALLNRTLARPEIIAAIRDRFPQGRRGGVGQC
ncbi:MAG: IS481 family transposase [Rhodospirillales bacterium]|nr:IS481 family transposase [Rhodospirillales bacterium]